MKGKALQGKLSRHTNRQNPNLKWLIRLKKSGAILHKTRRDR